MMITKDDYIALKQKERRFSELIERNKKDRQRTIFNSLWISTNIIPFTAFLSLAILLRANVLLAVLFGCLVVVSVIWTACFCIGWSYPRDDFLDFDVWYEKHKEKRERRKEAKARQNEYKKLERNARERRVLIAMYEADIELQSNIEEKNKALADDFNARLKNNR